MKSRGVRPVSDDRSNFNIRIYAPRTFGLLAPLQTAALDAMMGFIPFHILATPEFSDMLQKLSLIGKEALEWESRIRTCRIPNDAGFPSVTSLLESGPTIDIGHAARQGAGPALDLICIGARHAAGCR